MTRVLPEEVVALIDDCIEGLDDLEALLLLRRTGIGWTSEAVSRELATAQGTVERALGRLRDRGILVETAGRFSFAPAESKRAAIDLLALAYTERPVRVISSIFSSRNRG
jgi:hypothetical protein